MFFFENEPHAICRNKIEFPTIDHECVLVHAKMILRRLFSSVELKKEAREPTHQIQKMYHWFFFTIGVVRNA